MRSTIALEFRKMRRLHTGGIVIILVVAVAALSSASLFSASTRESFDDPTAQPWAALLLTYTLMASMISPIFAAVLASRQTDIEHTGQGWTLAATAGITPGALCRAKLAALSAIILVAVLLQSLLVIAAGKLAGIETPLTAAPWIGYTLLLILLDIAFCALHIWIATTIENQLVSIGIGMLGAFLGVFSLLTSGIVSRIVPWGYYAVISHVAQTDNTIGYVSPPYIWVAGSLLLGAGIFSVATHRLDRLEG